MEIITLPAGPVYDAFNALRIAYIASKGDCAWGPKELGEYARVTAMNALREDERRVLEYRIALMGMPETK